MNKPYLSIIIPAYNEKKNFKNGALNKVNDYTSKLDYAWEVLIIDDGSNDGSDKLIADFCDKHPGFKYIKNSHMGKAATVKKGVMEAIGENILFTDFDQATPLSEWEKLEPYFKHGYKVVIGSRELAGSMRQKEPFYRHLMGKGFNFGVQLLTVYGIHDTQCGFKAFNGEVAKKLFSKLQVYKSDVEISRAFTGAFDVEILFIAKKMGYKIMEVPIKWQHVPTDRINPIKDSFLMAIDVIKIRMNDLQGKYTS